MRDVARIPGAKRVQRLSLIAAIGIGAVAFTGCSAINPQSTTLQYSASDGIRYDLGDLELRNVLIASDGADAPGRLVGTFYNNADTDVVLTINGAAGSVAKLTIEPGIPLVLNGANDEVILDTVTAGPGALETLTLSESGASSATGSLDVPVLDGTLAEYAPLVPTPATPTATPSATHEASHEASDDETAAAKH